jgi:hypothetical protein
VWNLLQSWIFFLFSSGKLEEDVGQGWIQTLSCRIFFWRYGGCCTQRFQPQLVAFVLMTSFFFGYNHSGIIKHTTMQIICWWDLLSLISEWSCFHVQNFACMSKAMNIFTSCTDMNN